MKKRTNVIIASTLAFFVSAAYSVQAQPDLNNAPKGGNPPNRVRPDKVARKAANAAKTETRLKAARETRMRALVTSEAKKVEALAGKPLTDAQKQQLSDAMTARLNAQRAAQDAYLSEVAKMTGLTIDELRLKMRDTGLEKEGRRDRRERRGVRKAAPAN